MAPSVRSDVGNIDEHLADRAALDRVVRGRGLLLGIALTAPEAKVVETAAREAGFLVNAAAPDLIRLAPPLVITEAQIAEFLTALPGVLDKAVS